MNMDVNASHRAYVVGEKPPPISFHTSFCRNNKHQDLRFVMRRRTRDNAKNRSMGMKNYLEESRPSLVHVEKEFPNRR